MKIDHCIFPLIVVAFYCTFLDQIKGKGSERINPLCFPRAFDLIRKGRIVNAADSTYSKGIPNGKLVQKALDDVSLNLRDNEFVAILGPSGSGKTTLLNIIGGLDRYDSEI